MPRLLDLSPELISSIVDHMAPDSLTLDNLCLVGNHNLLALVRPYTWREINTTLDDAMSAATKESSLRLAARFKEFVENPTRAAAVRSINITLLGLFDMSTPAIHALMFDVFPQLSNVTHASIDCVNSTNHWGSGPGHGRLVKLVVQMLPSLLSLSVDSFNDGYGNEYLDMLDHPVPKLVHVVTRFCNPDGLTTLLKSCHNLRVIEMEGGLAVKFWQNRAIDPSEKFYGYRGHETGIGFVFNGELPEAHTPIFPTVDRINLTSDALYDDSDSWTLQWCFEEDHRPSASLKEFVVNMAIDVGQYRQIVLGARSRVIERLAVTGPLASLLAHAPVLQHLYFDRPAISQDLCTAAQNYAESIVTLRSISWWDSLSFRIARNDSNPRVPNLIEIPYVAPAWQRWNGIGKWWQV
ncbi:hypothetical protein B0H10DRAFT_1947811 [Mycena sp. CBHHK59/15]|nr:hypothetical protein B0H10DRAFT_1947811 [Mycena sp. CBHHK59/15]